MFSAPRYVCILLLCLLLFPVNPSLAQTQVKASSDLNEDKTKTLYVRNSSQLIARTPSGRKMGELYINSPVKLLEEKNGWAKVSVETWIRSNALTEKKKKKRKAGASSKDLKILSYKTRIVSDGLPAKRLYVTLKLKNTTKKLISSWNSLLVGQQGGKVFFREPIADDTKPIKAGESSEINFYWEDGEKPFNTLFGVKPSEVQLNLYKLKTK